MATVTKYRHGVPSWADVAVADPAAGAAFYSGVFGWDAEDQGAEAGNYHMFRLGGAAVAGLGPKMSEGAPLWSAYVSVDDLAATLEKAEAAGGTVVVPAMDVMDAGSMAVVLDPTGAPISFWQPGEHIGAEVVNVPNTLAWHELTTREPEASRAFYTSVLDWEFAAMPDDTSGQDGYRVIMVGDRMVGGMLPMVGDDWGDLPSHWMVYFAVADTDATADAVRNGGGSVAVEPFDMPIGRMAVCNDPDGNAFSIMAFAGEPDAVEGGVA